MFYLDKQTGREIEVFTTHAEGRKSQYTGIEVTNNGEWKEEIGCWFEDGRLVDYDGSFGLAIDCIRALRKAGWSVPRDYELDALLS